MSTASEHHRPVLLEEVLELLDPRSGDVILDATVGPGGHATPILQRLGASGLLVGVDHDADALELARSRLQAVGYPFRLFQGGYERILEFLELSGVPPEGALDGVLFDLGVSSLQLDRPERGFSFSHDGPLDMRMDPQSGVSAKEFLRTATVEEIRRVIRTYGEEPAAARIARAIDSVRRREKLSTTGQLARIVEGVVPRKGKKRHPATRTFQAIRIAVNGELESLRLALRDLDRRVKPGGRVVVLSYHSLEDRLVKESFRERVQEGIYQWAVAGVVRPSAREVEENPRARSAKLRAVRRDSLV